MTEPMTLKEARDLCDAWGDVPMSDVHMPSLYLRRVRDAIDAHLAQPAQAVDVGAIREVIADMDCDMDMPVTADAWRDKLTRAISGEKAGRVVEWEAAFHAQRAAAMRAHTICYETMLARPDVAELGDDGRLHDAIHDILRVDGPASPAPDKEGM